MEPKFCKSGNLFLYGEGTRPAFFLIIVKKKRKNQKNETGFETGGP
ncbi:hypothetical protein HMPREF3293_01359 [Christensenella minuta]|uniref:Uncharacterized protein n=1 Tax=Christensenella minuta TaxID=626937 RepID=A0A136Q5N1_9FIRM|nr:hypothetical protein HMPREF3293_01359 [Christensenella minuta]